MYYIEYIFFYYYILFLLFLLCFNIFLVSSKIFFPTGISKVLSTVSKKEPHMRWSMDASTNAEVW